SCPACPGRDKRLIALGSCPLTGHSDSLSSRCPIRCRFLQRLRGRLSCALIVIYQDGGERQHRLLAERTRRDWGSRRLASHPGGANVSWPFPFGRFGIKFLLGDDPARV